jgi:hypothetical protein
MGKKFRYLIYVNNHLIAVASAKELDFCDSVQMMWLLRELNKTTKVNRIEEITKYVEVE